ncbi:MAG: GntR family transcriptional regulator [Sphaerochaetaceae bacterium]
MEILNETKTSKIANTLEKLILEGKLEKGSFLPSQKELADQFKTSSRPVREALKLLEAKGLIQINQGRKAQISSNNLDQFVSSLSASLFSQYTSNRKMMHNLFQVCTNVITSAARGFSGSTEHKNIIDELENCTSLMRKDVEIMSNDKVTGVKKFINEENKFLHVLVKANNNQILLAIYENLIPLIDNAVIQLQLSQSEIEKRFKDYTYLFEALKNEQTDLAVALALVTLNSIEGKVLDKYPKESIAFA